MGRGLRPRPIFVHFAYRLRTILCGTGVVLPRYGQEQVQKFRLFPKDRRKPGQLLAALRRGLVRVEEVFLHVLGKLLPVGAEGVAVHTCDHIRRCVARVPLDCLDVAAEGQLHGRAEVPEGMKHNGRQALDCDNVINLYAALMRISILFYPLYSV